MKLHPPFESQKSDGKKSLALFALHEYWNFFLKENDHTYIFLRNVDQMKDNN